MSERDKGRACSRETHKKLRVDLDCLGQRHSSKCRYSLQLVLDYL